MVTEGEYTLWVRLLILQILKKKKLNTSKIKELTLKMSDIIGDAELTEMEDGDILMDSVSETKVKEIWNGLCDNNGRIHERIR